jgi:hypothetical protein
MIEISNCCNAPFGYPGWPDCDICSQCGEHSDLEICEDVGDSQYKDKKDILTALYRSMERLNEHLLSGECSGAAAEKLLQINLRKHFKEIK